MVELPPKKFSSTVKVDAELSTPAYKKLKSDTPPADEKERSSGWSQKLPVYEQIESVLSPPPEIRYVKTVTWTGKSGIKDCQRIGLTAWSSAFEIDRRNSNGRRCSERTSSNSRGGSDGYDVLHNFPFRADSNNRLAELTRH